MTLTTSIAATTKALTLQVRVNNVLLSATDPNTATGNPGVIGLRITNRIGQAPVASIDVSRTATWVTRGMPVAIDIGYDGFTKRRFTGTVQDRSKGIGRGTINCIGSSSPLYTTSIIPDQTFTGQTTASALANLISYVGIVGTSITTTRADVTEFTLGSVTPAVLKNMSAIQMASYIMELQGCKIFETGGGVTVINVIDQIPAATPIKTYTTNDNTTARILSSDLREDPTFVRTRVKVSGATPTGGVGLTATAQVGGVSPLVKPALPSGSYIDAGIFNSLADTQAKVDAMSLFYLTQWHRIPKYLDINIPGDPELECAATIGLVIPEQDINGNFFIDGWEDSVTESEGYRTTLSGLRGGDDLGGTLSIAPIAAFTMQPEREVFGTGTTDFVVVTLDASGSFDPDGSLTGVYTWTSNKTTIPTMASSTAKVRTVRIDSASLDGSGTDWTITLSVTDNSGATNSVTLTVPYPTTSTLVTIPAIGLAYNSGVGYSPDGGKTWNDTTGATCVSVAVRPADGTNSGHILAGFSNGVIKRSIDAGVTFSTVYTVASAASIVYVVYDWRNSLVAWGMTANMELLISLNAGSTWTIYDSLRTTLGLSGAIPARRAIGLPAAGGVYVFGGNGNGTPLIAYDTSTGAHAWVNQVLLGDIVTDFPADATCRIIDITSPIPSESVMILEFASGGGALIQPIYHSTSPPGTSTTWTRASGLTAGLKNGRYVVGDAPSRGAGFYYAAFGDRDIWSTSDGVTWTQIANVMPAGVTPNDAIWAAGILTGYPDFTGLYLIAAQIAGNTVGLYKSADGMQTVTPLRPAGGSWPAWPASGQGKMVSIGAPSATVAGSGDLARITSACTVQEFDNSANWVTLGDSAGSQPHNLFKLSSGHWVFVDLLGSVNGQVYHSADGVTWTLTLAKDASRGVYGFDVSADGTLWAVYSASSASTNGQNTKPLLLYKSTDSGANFTLVYTDPGFTGGGLTNANTIAHLANNCLSADKVNANRVFVVCEGSSNVMPDSIYTTDGGANWSTRTNPTTDVPRGSAGQDEIQFINGSRILYLKSVTTSQLWYSDDMGATWTQSTYSPTSANSVVSGPYKSTWFNRMVVCGGASPNRQFLISSDNGVTFTQITVSGWPGAVQSAIEYDPSTDTIYSTAAGTVSKITPVFAGTPVYTDISYNAGSASASSSQILALPR